MVLPVESTPTPSVTDVPDAEFSDGAAARKRVHFVVKAVHVEDRAVIDFHVRRRAEGVFRPGRQRAMSISAAVPPSRPGSPVCQYQRCPRFPIRFPMSPFPDVPVSRCPRFPMSQFPDVPVPDVPVSRCPRFPMSPFPDVPVSRCPRFPMSPFPDVPVSRCPRFPMSPFPDVPFPMSRFPMSPFPARCPRFRLLGLNAPKRTFLGDPCSFMVSRFPWSYQ